MSGERINRVSGIVLIVLSLIALLTILTAYRVSFAPFSIYTQPREPDEGTQAHIFQLSIVALAPAGLLFLATADWTRPLRSLRPLAFSGVAVVLAFGLLYYFEHH
jgi:formate hydrogenlyase subunit 3/multisubunit Na+/H+ antiporter MnhD subunit